MAFEESFWLVQNIVCFLVCGRLKRVLPNEKESSKANIVLSVSAICCARLLVCRREHIRGKVVVRMAQ